MPEPTYTLRPAVIADVETITGFLRQMLEEMAVVGGYEVSTSRRVWDERRQAIIQEIDSPEHHFLVARTLAPNSRMIGIIEASIRYPPLILTPIPILHVHAIFVSEPYRRKGVGTALMIKILDWGRAAGCVAAELNVLAGNPARLLYDRCGFGVHQLEMRLLF